VHSVISIFINIFGHIYGVKLKSNVKNYPHLSSISREWRCIALLIFSGVERAGVGGGQVEAHQHTLLSYLKNAF